MPDIGDGLLGDNIYYTAFSTGIVDTFFFTLLEVDPGTTGQLFLIGSSTDNGPVASSGLYNFSVGQPSLFPIAQVFNNDRSGSGYFVTSGVTYLLSFSLSSVTRTALIQHATTNARCGDTLSSHNAAAPSPSVCYPAPPALPGLRAMPTSH